MEHLDFRCKHNAHLEHEEKSQFTKFSTNTLYHPGLPTQSDGSDPTLPDPTQVPTRRDSWMGPTYVQLWAIPWSRAKQC